VEGDRWVGAQEKGGERCMGDGKRGGGKWEK